MNISIPADLKQRMDAVKVRVNWSGIAAHAFRVHLYNLAVKKGKKTNMKTVIERLKISKQASDSASLNEGERDGREWAERKAEAKQLERLEAAYNATGGWWFQGGSTSAYAAAELFYFIIEPDDDGDRSAANDFWTRWFHEERPALPDDEYVNGFADGALDLWQGVKDQL
jgi:hypothetical protein